MGATDVRTCCCHISMHANKARQDKLRQLCTPGVFCFLMQPAACILHIPSGRLQRQLPPIQMHALQGTQLPAAMVQESEPAPSVPQPHGPLQLTASQQLTRAQEMDTATPSLTKPKDMPWRRRPAGLGSIDEQAHGAKSNLTAAPPGTMPEANIPARVRGIMAAHGSMPRSSVQLDRHVLGQDQAGEEMLDAADDPLRLYEVGLWALNLCC